MADSKETVAGKGLSAEERAADEIEEGEIAIDDAPVDASAAGRSHVLEHSWTFWFDNPSSRARQAAWGSAIRPIHTFATVEDFWGAERAVAGIEALFCNSCGDPDFDACWSPDCRVEEMYSAGVAGFLGSPRHSVYHLATKIRDGKNGYFVVCREDFHCFKHGIEPKWEDPICANGGKWTISCSRGGNQGRIDTWWLYTLLAMIGEQFDHGDEICGAVVNIRGKQEKISIWTKNGSNESAQVSIARQWKEFLDYNDNIGFILHDDSMKNDKSAKNRYTA